MAFAIIAVADDPYVDTFLPAPAEQPEEAPELAGARQISSYGQLFRTTAGTGQIASRVADEAKLLVDRSKMMTKLTEQLKVIRQQADVWKEAGKNRKVIEALRKAAKEIEELFAKAEIAFKDNKSILDFQQIDAVKAIEKADNANIKRYQVSDLLHFLCETIEASTDPMRTAILWRYFIDTLGIFENVGGAKKLTWADIVRNSAFNVKSLDPVDDLNILENLIGETVGNGLIFAKRRTAVMPAKQAAIAAFLEFGSQLDIATRLQGIPRLFDEAGISKKTVDFSEELATEYKSFLAGKGANKWSTDMFNTLVRYQLIWYALLKWLDNKMADGITVIELHVKGTTGIKVRKINLVNRSQVDIVRDFEKEIIQAVGGSTKHSIRKMAKNTKTGVFVPQMAKPRHNSIRWQIYEIWAEMKGLDASKLYTGVVRKPGVIDRARQKWVPDLIFRSIAAGKKGLTMADDNYRISVTKLDSLLNYLNTPFARTKGKQYISFSRFADTITSEFKEGGLVFRFNMGDTLERNRGFSETTEVLTVPGLKNPVVRYVNREGIEVTEDLVDFLANQRKSAEPLQETKLLETFADAWDRTIRTFESTEEGRNILARALRGNMNNEYALSLLAEQLMRNGGMDLIDDANLGPTGRILKEIYIDAFQKRGTDGWAGWVLDEKHSIGFGMNGRIEGGAWMGDELYRFENTHTGDVVYVLMQDKSSNINKQRLIQDDFVKTDALFSGDPTRIEDVNWNHDESLNTFAGLLRQLNSTEAAVIRDQFVKDFQDLRVVAAIGASRTIEATETLSDSGRQVREISIHVEAFQSTGNRADQILEVISTAGGDSFDVLRDYYRSQMSDIQAAGGFVVGRILYPSKLSEVGKVQRRSDAEMLTSLQKGIRQEQIRLAKMEGLDPKVLDNLERFYSYFQYLYSNPSSIVKWACPQLSSWHNPYQDVAPTVQTILHDEWGLNKETFNTVLFSNDDHITAIRPSNRPYGGAPGWGGQAYLAAAGSYARMKSTYVTGASEAIGLNLITGDQQYIDLRTTPETTWWWGSIPSYERDVWTDYSADYVMGEAGFKVVVDRAGTPREKWFVFYSAPQDTLGSLSSISAGNRAVTRFDPIVQEREYWQTAQDKTDFSIANFYQGYIAAFVQENVNLYELAATDADLAVTGNETIEVHEVYFGMPDYGWTDGIEGLEMTLLTFASSQLEVAPGWGMTMVEPITAHGTLTGDDAIAEATKLAYGDAANRWLDQARRNDVHYEYRYFTILGTYMTVDAQNNPLEVTTVVRVADETERDRNAPLYSTIPTSEPTVTVPVSLYFDPVYTNGWDWNLWAEFTYGLKASLRAGKRPLRCRRWLSTLK